MLYSAAERPRLDFHYDLDEFSYSTFDNPCRVMVQALCFRASARCAFKNYGGMLGDLHAAWSISNLFFASPSYYSIQMSGRMRLWTLKCLQKCAFLIGRDPNRLRALLSVIDGIDTSPDFVGALRNECYRVVELLRNYHLMRMLSNSEDIEATIPPSVLQRTGLPRTIENRAYMTRLMQIWTEASPVIGNFRNDPERMCIELERIGDRWLARHSVSNQLNSFLFPVGSGTWSCVGRAQAELATTRALIGALIIRAKTGKLPMSIGEIPGDHIDPFSKKPLVLKRSGSSIRIYSIGLNKRDDGGLVPHEVAGVESDDIVAADPPVKLARTRR